MENFVKDKLNEITELLAPNLEHDGYNITNVKLGQAFNIKNSDEYMIPVIYNNTVVKFIQLYETENLGDYSYSACVGDFFHQIWHN